MPARLSDAIAVARVVAILGMVYVHAWTGLPGWKLAASDATAQGVLRWTLMELLGRSAVPLLGMISGWLVANAALSRPWRQFVAGKARTIVLPMVLWNAIAIVLVSSAAFAGILMAPRPPLSADAFGWLLNELTSLTRTNHINVQAPFLRDLFVCMMAAPLLARLSTRWLGVIVGLAMIWSVSGVAFPLLLRPAILVFFVSGMMIRRVGLETRVLEIPFWLVVAPFVGLAAVRIGLATTDFVDIGRHGRAALDLTLRFGAALAGWRIAWALAGSRLAPMLLRAEKFMFFMFCCHLILMWFGGPAIGAITGPLGSPLYPVFLVLQPFLILAVSIGLALGLLKIWPAAARVLSGGRLKGASSSRRPAPAAVPAAAAAQRV